MPDPDPNPNPQPAPNPPAPAPDPQPQPSPAPSPPAPGEQTVPYQRFADVTRELAEMRRWREERENADKSDVERANDRAKKAEDRVAELEGRANRLERQGWIAAAAQRQRFIDPADALARLRADDPNLENVDSEQAAATAVEKLAKEHEHLIAPEGGQPPPVPRVGSVLGGGGSEPDDDVPRDGEGNVDVRRGIGQDLLGMMTGRRGGG